jgi:hypothetical protein
MATHGTGGEARPGGAAVLRRVDTEQFERHVANLQESLTLAAGTKVWATVRYGEDEVPRLEIRAATARGDTTAAREIPLPAGLKAALKEVIDEHKDAVLGDLKTSIARTLAAQVLGIHQEEEG